MAAAYKEAAFEEKLRLATSPAPTPFATQERYNMVYYIILYKTYICVYVFNATTRQTIDVNQIERRAVAQRSSFPATVITGVHVHPKVVASARHWLDRISESWARRGAQEARYIRGVVQSALAAVDAVAISQGGTAAITTATAPLLPVSTNVGSCARWNPHQSIRYSPY